MIISYHNTEKIFKKKKRREKLKTTKIEHLKRSSYTSNDHGQVQVHAQLEPHAHIPKPV